MRKFLKQLRKGLRTACVTAALATCWNVGQSVAHAGYSYGDDVTVQFSGTVSPTISDLSHVYLIYGSGSSGGYSAYNAVRLGDFLVSGPSSFSAYGDVVYDDYIIWFITGIYGETGDGYTEGINGVALSASYNPSSSYWDSWDDFVHIPEETMFNYLLNDDIASLSTDQYSRMDYHVSFGNLPTLIERELFNFSEISENGVVQVNFEIVPEPITVLLFGSGGVVVLRRKRRKEQGD